MDEVGRREWEGGGVGLVGDERSEALDVCRVVSCRVVTCRAVSAVYFIYM